MVGHVHHHQVCARAHRDAAQVLAAQRRSAPDSRGMEDFACGHRTRRLRHQAGQIAHVAHFLDHVVRIRIRADAQVDACAAVAPEIAQRHAAAHEHRRAMRHAGARFGQDGQVGGGVPVRVRVVIDEDAMTDDAARIQHAQAVQPLHGRQAMAPGDLVELRQRLRGVRLPADATALGLLVAGLQQFRRAGVDLRRHQHARKTTAFMRLGFIDQRQRAFHAGLARLLVPVVLHDVAILRVPARRAEHGRDVGAQAALHHDVDPVLVRHRHVHHGRHARHQQFGRGQRELRGRRLVIAFHRGHVLVQIRVVQARRAGLVRVPLVDGFMHQVTVDVHQPRHDHHAAAAHNVRIRRGGLRARPDVRDAPIRKRHVGVLHVDMLLTRRVPGDHDLGILDQGSFQRNILGNELWVFGCC